MTFDHRSCWGRGTTHSPEWRGALPPNCSQHGFWDSWGCPGFGLGRGGGGGGVEQLGRRHAETRRGMRWTTRVRRGVGSENRETTPATTSTAPVPTTGLPYPGNDTTRNTGRSDPTQHAEGRTGDCPRPRKETATRQNVTGVPPPLVIAEGSKATANRANHQRLVPNPPPPFSEWAKCSPGLRRITNFICRLWPQLVEAKHFLWRL